MAVIAFKLILERGKFRRHLDQTQDKVRYFETGVSDDLIKGHYAQNSISFGC